MKAYQFSTPYNIDTPIKLGLFSDVHFDSPDCDKISLKQHFDYCLKDGRYILVNGDWFDAILLKDQKRAVNHLMENSDAQLNVKIEESAHFLEPYKNNILLMGRGNHEESILKYSGLDMLQMLTALLNAGEKHKIEYGNYSNFVRFTTLKNNKSVAAYDIYMTHGMGAAAGQTKGMLDFSRLAKGYAADLIWLGHKHNSIIDSSSPIMFIDNFGNVILKNRVFIETPAYQKGRTDDHNINFAERFYDHTALSGFGELTLTPRYVQDKPTLVPDIKITNNAQAVLGQVQAAKLQLRQKQR